MSDAQSLNLSVISPVYKNAETLAQLIERTVSVASQYYASVEHILVLDGISDNSLEVLEPIVSKDPRIKVVVLTRNFGQHTALMAGLEYATGDHLMFLDADLEEPPELLPTFLVKLMSGYEIVVGKRDGDHRGWFKTITAQLYTTIYNRLSDYKIIGDSTSMRLMTRKYVTYLLRFNERPFLGGFCSWIGLPIGIVAVPWEKQPRQSSYNLRKLISHARVGIVGFSGKLIRISLICGLLVSSGSLLFGAYIIARYFLVRDFLLGFPAIMTSMCFLLGLLYILIGIIGEYVYEIFLSVKNRPQHLVLHTINVEEGYSCGNNRFVSSRQIADA